MDARVRTRNVEAKKKMNIAIYSMFCLLLVPVMVGVLLLIDHSRGSRQHWKEARRLKDLCQWTLYKQTCFNSIFASGKTGSPITLSKVELQLSISALKEAKNSATKLKELANDSRTNQALENCYDLIDSSIDDLKNVFDHLSADRLVSRDEFRDFRILISGAVTFLESCLDEFENVNGGDDVDREKMNEILSTSRKLTINSLDMMNFFYVKPPNSTDVTGRTNRRLLYEETNVEFPSNMRHKLLAKTPPIPDVVVAKDGSGKYMTITEALKTVPENNYNKTFVIYIKNGIYREYVEVTHNMTNVMLIGDGPDKTIITGNKSYADGTNIMNTATVTIVGAHFMAKDIGFKNTAGAMKNQAVALRVLSHTSVFYNCLIDAYQNTLYAHAHSQFYRDCTISGTIDFIFGDAAAFFQNCTMIIKKPLPKQQCTVTAQGRSQRNAGTGFILQNCTITGEPKYKVGKDVNKAYLGRPRKEYSRTIIMESEIDDVIQPEGWLPWNGGFALHTLWYAEFGNRGSGSNQNQRVKWEGIRTLTDNNVANFTLAKFLGEDWIKTTDVTYTSGMMNV